MGTCERGVDHHRAESMNSVTRQISKYISYSPSSFLISIPPQSVPYHDGLSILPLSTNSLPLPNRPPKKILAILKSHPQLHHAKSPPHPLNINPPLRKPFITLHTFRKRLSKPPRYLQEIHVQRSRRLLLRTRHLLQPYPTRNGILSTRSWSKDKDESRWCASRRLLGLVRTSSPPISYVKPKTHQRR